MAEPACPFTRAAAVSRVYDRLLVPRLFGPWAELLLDSFAISEGEAVLDVATGPGTVARTAARRAGPPGRIVATDRSTSMLAVALAKPPVGGGDYVEAPAGAIRRRPAELPPDGGAVSGPKTRGNPGISRRGGAYPA